MNIGDNIILEAVEIEEDECEGCYFKRFDSCIYSSLDDEGVCCEGLFF